ncbi:hypothetical protein [Vibrio europaeus]|uniref:hypothetical protein n=1 Tax=Vibrio europaeus TaxID=300876 RepID=UPI00233F0530|nr:hypothetical protein [Vibrio europaeus]MDC5711159.1 hypothetical protein [Vibrio europaeus]MDC5713188.1 hypothetical protein [Vibrio europaeus]
MNKILINVLIGLTLAGCASEQYENIVRENDEVQQQITDKTTYIKQDKVQFIEKPPLMLSTIEEKVDQKWLSEEVTISDTGRPLSIVLEEVMSGVDIPIYFSENVDPNKEVSLNFSHTRQNVLNLISRVSGYGIEVKNGRLEVTKYVTKVYPLNLPSGTMSGQLGSQGETSGEDSIRVEGQYLNIQYDETDITTEVSESIIKFLGGDDEARNRVGVLPSLSSISVTATPDQMQTIDKVVKTYQDELSKQVYLEIQMIEFRSNLGTERGIDWNIVKETGSGSLKFFIPGTNTVSQDAGYGFGFSGTGKWSGTESFIKVLEKQGSVSTQTPITAMLLNNQPAKLTQQRREPYLYEASSESSEGVVSASVTREVETEGVDMMVNAKVQDDHVFLRISGQLKKIDERETKTVQQIDLGFLHTQDVEITFANKVRYGQTYVIASVKQSSKTAERSTNFFSTLFGGTGSQDDTTETLVLLTPRKAM